MRGGRGHGRVELERMVDALEQIHRGEGGSAKENALRSVLHAAAGPDRVYAEASRLFTAQEKLLRAQSAAAGKLIDGLRNRASTPRQTVLRLLVAELGATGGRFVLHNESSRPSVFTFRPEFSLPIRFNPPTPTVPAGGSVAVDVRVELDGSFTAGETATLLVDVMADGRPRLKLWLDLTVAPTPPADGPRPGSR